MILAGLVAEPITFGERDLLEMDQHEVRMLEHCALSRFRPPEVVPYLEVWQQDGFGGTRWSVRAAVPCVTLLP